MQFISGNVNGNKNGKYDVKETWHSLEMNATD